MYDPAGQVVHGVQASAFAVVLKAPLGHPEQTRSVVVVPSVETY
jgi:hypothetical protein